MSPSPRPRHFLWELYLALASEGGCSEPAGRQAIRDLLPKYADILDVVISAEGDISKLDPAIMQRHEERMRQERRALPGNGLNERIRQRRESRGIPANTDMNAHIRALSAAKKSKSRLRPA